MTTIGERIASIRNQVKSVKQDAFLTDRFVYSLIMKHASLFMRRQDSLNRIMKFLSSFSNFTASIKFILFHLHIYVIQSNYQNGKKPNYQQILASNAKSKVAFKCRLPSEKEYENLVKKNPSHTGFRFILETTSN